MTKRPDDALRSVPRSRQGISALRSRQRLRALRFEPLEDRRLLSVAPALPASLQPHSTLESYLPATFDYTGTSSPTGYSPNQIRAAYGLGTYSAGSGSLADGNYVPGSLQNGISFGGISGISGDGRGQTIAIVDAYDDPGAATDLNTFSAQFGLPIFGGAGDPTFTQLTQTGQPVSRVSGNQNYVPTDPAGPSYQHQTNDSTWEMEESLDIEWANAMAPMANIILFEGNNANDLYTAVYCAAQHRASTSSL